MPRLLSGSPTVLMPPSLKTLLHNAVWLVFDRGARFILVFATGVVVTRFLGPNEAGVLGYALALAMILAGLCDLGLDSIIRMEVIRTPKERGALLGTAAALRLMAAPVAFLAFVWLVPKGVSASVNLAFICGIGVTLCSPIFLTLDSWFQSQVQARYSVWSQTGGLTAGMLLRLTGVATGASLAWFGWAAGLEMIVMGLLLLWFYQKNATDRQPWRFTQAAKRRLLAQAWPLALTNIAILIYTRIDIVLLSHLTDAHETGIYGAAVRFTEAGYILPMILINTLFPLLTRLHVEDAERFLKILRRLLIAVAWGGMATAAIMSLTSSWIVRIAYGQAFSESADVLVISAWSAVFAGLGAVRAQWLLLHGLQRYGLYYVAMGAALNAGLNILLLPVWGAMGAACAGLATQAFIVLVAPLFFPETRPSVPLLLGAFIFAGLR